MSSTIESIADPGGDPYALLNVAFDANDSAIKAAYRVRSLSVHPDKNPDNPHAADLFHAVKAASEALLNAHTRALIDTRLAAAKAVIARQAALGQDRLRMRALLEAREATAATALAAVVRGADVARLRSDGIDRARAMTAKAEEAAAATAAARADAAAAKATYTSAFAVVVAWTAEVDAAFGIRGGVTDAALRAAFFLCGEIDRVERGGGGGAVLVFVGQGGSEAALVAPPPGYTTRRIEVVAVATATATGNDAINAPAAASEEKQIQELEDFEKRVLARCLRGFVGAGAGAGAGAGVVVGAQDDSR